MPALWERFREGGWPNWLILLLGVVGMLAGSVAIVVPLVSKKRLAALLPGLGAAALACFILGTGMGGMLFNLRRVESAISGGAIRPTLRERIYRMGLDESKSCVEFSLGFALYPSLGAIIALVLATRRRSDAAPPPGGAFSNLPPPAPSSNLAPFLGLGMLPLFFAGALALHSKKAPGKELDLDSYQVADALDEVEEGNAEAGCRRIADFERLDPTAPARSLPELGELAKRCAGHDLDAAAALLDPAANPGAALPLSRPEAQRKLRAWKESTLPVDAETKTKIDATLTRLAEPPPERDSELGAPPARAGASLKMGSTQVNGRLPPEVIQRIVRQSFARFRLCYERALKREPTLSVQVKTRFVIDATGATSAVQTSADHPVSQDLLDCVGRGFKQLSFPAPEGGIVTVVYPINFTPG
jgi:hypothetical protein